MRRADGLEAVAALREVVQRASRVAAGQAKLPARVDDVRPREGGPPALLAPGDPAPPAGDASAPNTQITAGPKSKTKTKTASFSFTSTEPGASFQCSLDDSPFEPCTSPEDLKVKKGKHTFEVRATDASGNTDPTPATQSWTVKKRKKK